MDHALDRAEAQGRAGIVARMLTHQFGTLPADVQDRLEAASAEELDAWGIALLGAPTLEAVFKAKPAAH